MSSNKRKLLIPFFSAGFPKLQATAEIIQALHKLGVDYIEVGLPHSDALADGPIIQASSAQALQNGLNIQILLNQVQSIKDKVLGTKLILFSYYNPIWAFGLKQTVQSWSEAGGSAILIPDLPMEEATFFHHLCEEHSLKLIFLLAPTSTPKRVKKIVELSDEFIYLVSVAGVTGMRESLSANLSKMIENIKSQKPNLKVVIGFGISNHETARQALKQGADGVVVGSALIQKLQSEGLEAACDLLAKIKTVL